MARMERAVRVPAVARDQERRALRLPGQPVPERDRRRPATPQGALELRALGDKYGIRFPGRHGSLNEARWDAEIAISKILGQDHVGESGPGGAGGVGSYQQTLRTAEQLNKLGKRSVELGLGPAYFHNHAAEFGATQRFMDNGVLKSGWEILMERTDPRWVVAQIDIGWAVCGGSGHVTPAEPGVGVAYVQRMIDTFGARVISFHVKDMGGRASARAATTTTSGHSARARSTSRRCSPRPRTRRSTTSPSATRSRIGGPTNFNPFNNTADSALALKGDPAPTLKAAPVALPVRRGGHAPRPPTPSAITITNDGDAPLTIGTATNVIQIQAEAADGGTATAGDFAVVSETCRGKSLAPERDVHDQRRLQAHAHQLRVGRARRRQLQRRRRDGAHPDRRPEHGGRDHHAGRHRPDRCSR